MTPCAPGRENIVIRTERALEFRIWYDSGQSIVNENVPRKPKHTFSPAVHEEEKRPKNWKFFVATQNGYILAEGRIPARCVRRVETCSVSQTGRRVWQQHRGLKQQPQITREL